MSSNRPDQFRPDLVVETVLAITDEVLGERGIDGLLLDADNTLVPRSRYELSAPVADWIAGHQAAGRRLAILSNSGHIRRVAQMVEPFGMAALSLARKPLRGGFRRGLKLLDLPAERVAMVGDQLFTDILGGNLAGLLTIMVRPLSPRDFVLYRPMRLVERGLLTRWGLPAAGPLDGDLVAAPAE